MRDLIDRQEAIKAMSCLTDGICEGEAIEALCELPTAEPEPCECAVSAIAVEEMLKDLLPARGMWEIEGDDAKNAICETVHDALEGLWKLPFVKPDSKKSSSTHKTLDTISRQEAIDVAFDIFPDDEYFREQFVKSIEALPSAEPERKIGRWEPVTNGRGGHWCNRCNEYAPSWMTGEEHLTNYCPNCGAYMRGKQDE